MAQTKCFFQIINVHVSLKYNSRSRITSTLHYPLYIKNSTKYLTDPDEIM